MSKLLIVGASGFFGRSIISFLSKNNKYNIRKVYFLCRKKINCNLTKTRIGHIKKNIISLKKIPLVDNIIYCAKLKNEQNDYWGLKNFLNLAFNTNKNSKFLYTSSGAVYGNINKILNTSEDYLLKNKFRKFNNKSKNLYALTKIRNEKLVQSFGINKGMNVAIARCYAFTGIFLPLKKNYAVGNFVNSVLKKKNIIVKSQIKTFRSYLHSDDLVKFLFKILFKADKKCPIYNLGSDDPISIEDLAIKLGNLYNIQVKRKNISKVGVDYYVPNINKFKKDFKLKRKLNSFTAVLRMISDLKKLV